MVRAIQRTACLPAGAGAVAAMCGRDRGAGVRADKAVSSAVDPPRPLRMSVTVIGANIPDAPSVAERSSSPSRLEALALASEPSGQQRL